MTTTIKGAFKLILIGLLLALIAMVATSAKPIDKIYEVTVKIKSGNCSNTVVLIVRASSSFEAQREAQKLARYSITTRVTTYKEVKR